MTDEELLAQVQKRERTARTRRRGGGADNSNNGNSQRSMLHGCGDKAPGRDGRQLSQQQQQQSNWDKLRESVLGTKKRAMWKDAVEQGTKPVPAIELWRRRKAKGESNSDSGSLLGTQILERLDKLDAEDALQVPDGEAWDGGRLADGRKPMVQLTGTQGSVSPSSRAFSYIVSQPFSQLTDHRFIGAASPAHEMPVKPLPPPPSRQTTPRQRNTGSPAAVLTKSARRTHTLALAGSKSLDRVLYKKLCG